MESYDNVEKQQVPGTEPNAEYIENQVLEDNADGAYEMKSELVNNCFQNEIGMGRYQWELFVLSGFGWMADSLWIQGVAATLPSVSREMRPLHTPFVTLALYVGLVIGAITWGVLADVIGRRVPWNITLFVSGIFGIAAGGSGDFVALTSLVACLGFGLGGNLPVDGALFLEFIPGSHQWLLTLLPVWWPFGQLAASLIAWGFLSQSSCTLDATRRCTTDENQGWRNIFYTLGCIMILMFVCRYVLFSLQESPKYLLAKGQNQEAIEVLQYVARRNRRTISLTLEQLDAVDGFNVKLSRPSQSETTRIPTILFSLLSVSHIKPLFSTRKLAINTSLTVTCWGLIGTAYPLYREFLSINLSRQSVYQGSSSIDETYRTYSIVSALGILGPVIACFMVDWIHGEGRRAIGGRKFTMALFTCLTGVLLLLFTRATSAASVLGFNCASGLTQNAIYSVLHAYTLEVFPAPHRGTGGAICLAINRAFGLLVLLIMSYGDLTRNTPLFVSASLCIMNTLSMTLLPIERTGRPAI